MADNIVRLANQIPLIKPAGSNKGGVSVGNMALRIGCRHKRRAVVK